MEDQPNLNAPPVTGDLIPLQFLLAFRLMALLAEGRGYPPLPVETPDGH